MKSIQSSVRSLKPEMTSLQMPLSFDSDERTNPADWRAAEPQSQLPPRIDRKFPVGRFSILRDTPPPGMGDPVAGRMVICGRMADVCAALERMAAGQPVQHV
jgi:hypothetical protein